MAVKALTTEDFMRENDRERILRGRIEKALAALRTIGPQHHAPEREFLKGLGVSSNEIGELRRTFRKYIALAPGILGRRPVYYWFGNPQAVPSKYRYIPESDSAEG